jgi:hypothetical protein
MREELLRLLAAEPFRIFRILLASGHAYEVQVPEMLVVEQDIATYFAPRSDLYSILRLVQISALDIMS